MSEMRWQWLSGTRRHLIYAVFNEQDPGEGHQLHGARPHPGVVRLRRPVQPRGGGALARQGDQPEPAAHPRPAAGHARRALETRPSTWTPSSPGVDAQPSLDQLQVFIKSELKVGVIYVKEGQYTEEEILDNNEHSPLFDEFLQIIGDKVRLKGGRSDATVDSRPFNCLSTGFDKYKGGLDTVHDLTGLYSVYTCWRGIEIMFHVSTLLPYEKNDPQKVGIWRLDDSAPSDFWLVVEQLQRKRHVGNDIVCVVFLEGTHTDFSPACIKSHFLHTFILVQVSPKSRRKPTKYNVSDSRLASLPFLFTFLFSSLKALASYYPLSHTPAVWHELPRARVMIEFIWIVRSKSVEFELSKRDWLQCRKVFHWFDYISLS